MFSVSRRVVRRALLLTGVSLTASLAGSLALPLPGHAQAPKTFYIAPDDHTDYMWTANEADYRDAFLRMLDTYLGQADATDALPSDFHSRWNTDGSFWMRIYEQNRMPAQFDRLMARVASGNISMPLNTLISTYGGTPTEAVLRNFYYAGRLERRYKLRFPYAIAMENQVLPFGLGSLYAGAGARYTWHGVCACVTRVPASGDRQFDTYWWGGLDGSKVLMKWYSQISPRGSEGVGGYAEARFPGEVIGFMNTNSGFRARNPQAVLGAFGKGWDDYETLTPLSDQTNSFPSVASQSTPAQRRVVVSNVVDYFQAFESQYGANLPNQAVSFGNEWELASASLAEVTAQVKRSVEKLRAAEAMATLVALRNPGFLAGRAAARDQAFVALGLYWEHDFVGGGPVSNAERAAWQRRMANDVTTYVDQLAGDARMTLGQMIRNPGGAGPRVFVFNPLSWTRNDVVEIAYSGPQPVAVFDVASGAEIPSEIATVGGSTTLRFSARSLPSLGYKVFELRNQSPSSFSSVAKVSGATLETGKYRLTLGPSGAITSLIDKARGRTELAAAIDGPGMNDFGDPTAGTVTLESNGPVSATLRADIAANPPRQTRLTLYRDISRIDIRNDINGNFTDQRGWRFGFNLDGPDLRHEEIGAVIRARLEPDGQYSARAQNARYDWLSLNHFADMGNSANTHGVVLSSPDLSFMQLGRSRTDLLDTQTPQLTVLAGGRIDNQGMDAQGGDQHFIQRFSVQGRGPRDLTAAMKFALEHQNPAVAGYVTGGAAAPYPENSYALLKISDPGVLVWALKPAEEGIDKGVILRVWNQKDTPATFNATLGAPYRLSGAARATHIETDLAALPVTRNRVALQANQRQIATYRLLVTAP